MKLSKKHKIVVDSDVTLEIQKIDGKTIISLESESVEIFEDVPDLYRINEFAEFLEKQICLSKIKKIPFYGAYSAFAIENQDLLINVSKKPNSKLLQEELRKRFSGRFIISKEKMCGGEVYCVSISDSE